MQNNYKKFFRFVVGHRNSQQLDLYQKQHHGDDAVLHQEITIWKCQIIGLQKVQKSPKWTTGYELLCASLFSVFPLKKMNAK